MVSPARALRRLSFAIAASLAFALSAIVSHARAADDTPSPADNTPAHALSKLKVADGLTIELFAADPLVRKPLTMSFDTRGRMWVIQYLQYPDPAGLKQVDVDEFRRIKYEKPPEPPPRGPKGADKVTILEDTDGDGRPDKAKDFVTGLNLATGLALGRGGVWVAQPPYLLFYPDKDRDDVPDGDPKVVLTGFGMEDAHATVNSLTWGPDGWLYGAQGSTVTANIRGIEFQQGIWRYHPPTDRFELFAEGGGNTYGLDFDRHGNLIAGTNFGGSVGLHMVQGGYYVKNFGKHGALHNPYAFGYFGHMPHEGWRGGHVTCGGIVYQADALPAKFRDKYIAANVLSNAIHWHSLIPHGSTFKSKYEGELVASSDVRFRPIDLTTGPDGAIYVADWADSYIQYQAPADKLDKLRGRIWRIAPKDAKHGFNEAVVKSVGNDLAKASVKDLMQLQYSRDNAWYAQQARGLLVELTDADRKEALRQLRPWSTPKELDELYFTWALSHLDSENGKLTIIAQDGQTVEARAWAYRILGDRAALGRIGFYKSPVYRENDPRIVAQIVATARRLPAKDVLPWVRGFAELADPNDPFIPLLLWWTIEEKFRENPDDVVQLFESSQTWDSKIVQNILAPRVARRCISDLTLTGYSRCARLLSLAKSDEHRDIILRGFEEQLTKPLADPPARLINEINSIRRGAFKESPVVLRLLAKLGEKEARGQLFSQIDDDQRPAADRVKYIELLALTGFPELRDKLINIGRANGKDDVRKAAILALGKFSDDSIGEVLLKSHVDFPLPIQTTTIQVLSSRKSWSRALIKAVDAGKIKKEAISADQLRQMAGHKDDEIASLIEKHYGRIAPQTAGEKKERARSLGLLVRASGGDAVAGKALYTRHCGNCHQLHGEGNKIGPDLTGRDRKNLDQLLAEVVDPSNMIRPEYLAYTAALADGRLLTGLIAESTPESVTILDAKNIRTTVARSEIESLKAQSVSLMPEKILDPLSPDELRSLFKYLQGDGK